MEASSPHRSDAEILEDLETFERDTRHSAEQAKHGELFDWAHQVQHNHGAFKFFKLLLCSSRI